MGGINIYCGSFSGDDKSGSAFEGVLAGMEAMASTHEGEAIARVKSALEDASDHILIEPDEARLLLPLLRRYSAEVDGQLAVPGDLFDQMARDEDESTIDATVLQFGAGLGWRAYCARDLLKAFEVADAEAEPVALVW
ncbi:hypothetical protein [Phenylobacterium sp.]|uniref:hypothetical protein n=1 Tax=Phenylobacterium sp. TaxID=1871053 RepID=UPI003D28DB22